MAMLTMEIADEMAQVLQRKVACPADAARIALAVTLYRTDSMSLTQASALAGVSPRELLLRLFRLLSGDDQASGYRELSRSHGKLLRHLMELAIAEGRTPQQVQDDFGCARSTAFRVWRQCDSAPRHHGRGAPRGMRARTRQRFAHVDWSQRDADIASLIGVSGEYVRQMRLKLTGRPSPRQDPPARTA